MMRFDVRKWGKRNLASNGAGQLAVRPGLRQVVDDDARQIAAAQTVVDGRTDDRLHCLIIVNTTAPLGASLLVLDQDFGQVSSVALNANVIPRGFSSGQVLQHAMLGSPDLPTLWGVVPSRFKVAEKYQPADLSLTALDIPRGIVTQWVNRIVIADGPNLFISVPVAITGGSPRTFLGQNQNARPGGVFGLHVGAGGSLVACTSRGVFALNEAAAAVGIVGTNGADWRLLAHHETVGYGSTCVVNGRVYGLTKRGYRLIDVEDGPEVDLDDHMMSYTLGTRIAMPDYRDCLMLPGDDGPIIYSPTHDALYMTELGGVDSWWTGSSDVNLKVVGTLKDTDGSTLIVTRDGVWSVGGNFDGLTELTSGYAGQPTGFAFEAPSMHPDENVTVRAVHMSAAQGTAYSGVRGEAQSSAAYFDVNGPIIGTSSWGGSWRYSSPPQVAHRHRYDINSNDLAVEIGVAGCGNRMGDKVSVDDGAQGKKRPEDRG